MDHIDQIHLLHRISQANVSPELKELLEDIVKAIPVEYGE